MKVEKLRIGKGRTVGDEKSGEWTREYYELEIVIENPGELEITRANAVSIINDWISASKPESKPNTGVGSDPAQLFPEDLRSLLSFEQKADVVVVKPRQFLGSENFAKIASTVKEQGGDYISAGKASHFRIPLKKQEA